MMKTRPSDKFGINMKRFCREHERWMEQELQRGGATENLLAIHLEKLHWLQHERLVHLLVLMMTLLAELFFVYLSLAHPETNPASNAVMLALAVLLAFYFAHYFFLENTTQHWYRIAESVMERLRHAPAAMDTKN
ncbi:MAG: hypothetical protein E7425_03965 [Ruminococcaceae bacterium]|nr:hypothetical protein [Oscillospiraceae bacterium]